MMDEQKRSNRKWSSKDKTSTRNWALISMKISEDNLCFVVSELTEERPAFWNSPRFSQLASHLAKKQKAKIEPHLRTESATNTCVNLQVHRLDKGLNLRMCLFSQWRYLYSFIRQQEAGDDDRVLQQELQLSAHQTASRSLFIHGAICILVLVPLLPFFFHVLSFMIFLLCYNYLHLFPFVSLD